MQQASLSHKFANEWNVGATVTHSKFSRLQDYVFSFGPAGAFGLPATDVSLYSYRKQTNQDSLTSDLSLGGKFDLLERTQQFFAALEYQKQDGGNYHFTSFG